MGRGDLTNAEWERLEPPLPPGGARGGRWNDHRMVINGVFYRTRTGLPWRDLPEQSGSWVMVYKRHRRWSADGTWERLLTVVQAAEDAAGRVDWEVSVDSTAVRAHQHAAGAPDAPPPVDAQKGGPAGTKQGDRVWRTCASSWRRWSGRRVLRTLTRWVLHQGCLPLMKVAPARTRGGAGREREYQDAVIRRVDYILDPMTEPAKLRREPFTGQGQGQQQGDRLSTGQQQQEQVTGTSGTRLLT
jgi:transposase